MILLELSDDLFNIADDVAVTLHADVESRSQLNIKLVGAHRYWEHPSTEALMMAYRIGSEPMRMWDRGQPQPPGMRQAIADGAVCIAHNAEFEMLAFEWLSRHHGWLAPKKYRCTAAMAAALALPRDLEALGEALGLAIRKDKDGKRLIDKFSKPRRDGSWNEPEDHVQDYELFRQYCARDVLTEEAAEARMIPLSDEEEKVYRLSLLINSRGLRIDRRSATAALILAERAKLDYDRKIAEVTGNAVKKCTEVGALHRWINDQGVGINSTAKADLVEAMHLDIPSRVRQAIQLRLAASKTSVSKVKAMLLRASETDDRVRGAFVYHVASTGRFQSFGVNFANLPRPRKVFEAARLNVRPAQLFRAIRTADPGILELYYGPDLGAPMHLLADAVRGFIWAARGKKLVVSDYTGIEGVVIAWLAGEEWKLAAFRAILADPSLPDMYRRTAAQIMGMSVEEIDKKHPLRQSVGKVSELALGFGGGVGAFASMARNYGVDLDGLYRPVYERADDFDIIAAERRYKECCTRKEKSTLALSAHAWIACELIKRGWRAANPAIKQSWWDLEEAVRAAIHKPGTITKAAGVSYKVAHKFLFARLPSGRCLAYAMPRLRAQVYVSRLVDGQWAAPEPMDLDTADKLEAIGKAKIERKCHPRITALGVDSQTKKFKRFGLYGGLLAENNTQAVARDVLIGGMFEAEAAGYPVIGTVYDEIITEVDRDFGSAEELSRLMCKLKPWARGLPLGADGYEAKRYRKG